MFNTRIQYGLRTPLVSSRKQVQKRADMQGRLSEDEINDVAAYVFDQASNDKW